MAEKKGLKNQYLCAQGHITQTIHRDSGTTPMFMDCKTCGKRATSQMGRITEPFEPTYEWIKPTPEEIEEEIRDFIMERTAKGKRVPQSTRDWYANSFKDHYNQGGLMLKKIQP